MAGELKSRRPHIGIFGRVNAGKSSFMNMVAGQDVSIVSSSAGTTTDIVEKSMELPPLGAVVLMDTAGLDDPTALGPQRLERTMRALSRSDIALLVAESGIWSSSEEDFVQLCHKRNLPLILVINKTDLCRPDSKWIEKAGKGCGALMLRSLRFSRGEESSGGAAGAADSGADSDSDAARDACLKELERCLVAVSPAGLIEQPSILAGLLPASADLPLVVLVTPIDREAPKGRLIGPEAQTIRDCLDNEAAALAVQLEGYPALLSSLNRRPDLVVGDSQIVQALVAATPPEIPCTTFSILFSRLKGDIVEMARGAAVLGSLRPGDRVLVAEACTHHPIEGDIGKTKIPRWIEQHCGPGIKIEHCAGADFPAGLDSFRLILHCGSCMLTRRETLSRIEKARAAGTAITNYGMTISVLQNAAERTLSPFPEALSAYREALNRREEGGR